MRRLVFGLLAALLFFPLSTLAVVTAQEATPGASGLADLGLPTIDIA